MRSLTRTELSDLARRLPARIPQRQRDGRGKRTARAGRSAAATAGSLAGRAWASTRDLAQRAVERPARERAKRRRKRAAVAAAAGTVTGAGIYLRSRLLGRSPESKQATAEGNGTAPQPESAPDGPVLTEIK